MAIKNRIILFFIGLFVMVKDLEKKRMVFRSDSMAIEKPLDYAEPIFMHLSLGASYVLLQYFSF